MGSSCRSPFKNHGERMERGKANGVTLLKAPQSFQVQNNSSTILDPSLLTLNLSTHISSQVFLEKNCFRILFAINSIAEAEFLGAGALTALGANAVVAAIVPRFSLGSGVTLVVLAHLGC